MIAFTIGAAVGFGAAYLYYQRPDWSRRLWDFIFKG